MTVSFAIMPRDDGKDPVAVQLQDLGTGSDRVAGDGLYCAYFTDFLPNQVRQGRHKGFVHSFF